MDIVLNKTGKEKEEKYEKLARLDLALRFEEKPVSIFKVVKDMGKNIWNFFKLSKVCSSFQLSTKIGWNLVINSMSKYVI